MDRRKYERPTRTIRHDAGICLLLLLCLSPALTAGRAHQPHEQASAGVAAPLLPVAQSEPQELRLNAPVEADLAGGESRLYTLNVRAKQFFRVVVEQWGIDVELILSDPQGKQAATVDRPNGWRGPETISHIAELSGRYTIRVRALEKVISQASYRIELKSLRNVEPQDESRITAERAVTEGERLRARSTEDSSRQAIDKFEQARLLWRALGENYEEAVALYGIAWAYTSLGENQAAIGYFTRALSLMQEVGDQYGTAITQNGLGWAYIYVGENERASNYFFEGLRIHRSVGNQRGEAVALSGLAWTHALLGREREALDTFKQSLALRQAVKDRRGEALTQVGIGKVYSRMGEAQRALDAFNRALEILRSATNDRFSEADALSNIGWTYLSMNRNQEALDNFRQVLSMRRATGDKIGEATTLYGVARSARRLGDLGEARARMEESLNIVEALRTKGTRQQLRISYFASVQDYYDTYIDLLMKLHKIDPAHGYDRLAFHASERARARGLLDTLTEANVDIREGVDPVLLERERTLQQHLNASAERQRQLLSRKHTADQTVALAKELRDLTARYEECEADIRAKSPRYAALTQPQPLTVDQAQLEILDGDTVLLQYALGEERSYLWLVTRDGLSSYELAPKAQIEALVRQVYSLLTARNTTEASETPEQKRVRVARADSQYWEAAAQLSQMLLGPVAERLGTKRLLIVAHETLQLIPFGALPLPAPGSRKRASVPLLVEHEIVYLPSASTLSVIRREIKGRVKAQGALAVLADPVFTNDDERFEPTQPNGTKVKEGALRAGQEVWRDVLDAIDSTEEQPVIPHLPRLFSTRWEAKEITSLVPPKERLLALDFEASRTLAMDKVIGGFRIIHFATHAFINNVHPELSGIVLSMVAKDGQPQDGFLRAHEIFNLRLPAELVVLSACRTGLGKEVRGEGLISLTRSFIYAGAPRVVVSLWATDDKNTAELMVRFYRHLLGPAGMPPAAALRRAQVEIWKRAPTRHPYFWGAFIQQGEWK